VKAVAVVAFLSGLLLAVRVMFFGVQRKLDNERLAHRAWPLALAAFLVAAGAMLYVRPDGVTGARLALVTLVSTLAGTGAWWVVRRSAAAPSMDPEDDPRYRFQGHVARVVETIEPLDSASSSGAGGRITFEFDGRRHQLRAHWLPESSAAQQVGHAGDEVVIERVEGDVAYVEPWNVVEERL
jgi:membrane protein implicated in regulation of membrane protease activity